MKRLTELWMVFVFLGISGCLPEGKDNGKAVEMNKSLSDENTVFKAVDPAQVPSGGTWGTVRSILNTNFNNINSSLDSVDVVLNEHGDSIVNYYGYIQARLKRSDSSLYATQSDLAAGLAAKQKTLVSGTNIKTINSQSLLGSGNIIIEGGSGSMVYPGAGIPVSGGSGWGASLSPTTLSAMAGLSNGSGVLTNDGSGNLSWAAAGGGSMIYPPAGIAVSNGTAWGSSIADNSANWNTAYSWGNHAVAGYLSSETSHSDVVVDGDFASQGLMKRGSTAGVYSIVTDNSVNWNTAYGWGNHASAGYYLGTNTTIRGLFSATVAGLTYTNSTGVISLTSGYTIPASVDISNWNTAYNWGDHSIKGYYVGTSSTIRGLFSSTATGLTYTSSTGELSLTSGYQIPTSAALSNAATAYGWGNHSSAGYFVGSNATIRGLFSSSATGLTYTSGTGVFSLTSGYSIPSTSKQSNWDYAYSEAIDTISITDVALAKHASFNSQTGTTYTLVITDDGKFVTMSNSSGNALTVPPNNSVAFQPGTQITIVQLNTGQTSIVAGSGVTINSAGGALKLRTRYSSATLVKTATDTWLLIGDITT